MINWGRRGRISLPWLYLHSTICEKLLQCSGFQEIYAQLEEVGGVSLLLIYVHSAIYETYAVKWCYIDLWMIRRGR